MCGQAAPCPAHSAPIAAAMHLEAVHCKPAARARGAVLEVGDDGMVDVLLLLAQEVRADAVEAVAAQLVIALDRLWRMTDGEQTLR